MTRLPVLRAVAARLFATLVLVVPPIIFIVGGGTWISRQLSIDRCLDRGGRWDHDAVACQTDTLPGTMPRDEAGRVE